MSGYHNHLTQLRVNLPDDSVIYRVLQSLPPSYKGFVMNYNMQGMEKTIPKLFGMLKAAEVEIKKEHQVLMVNKTTSFKKKGKGKKGNFKKNDKQVAAQVKKPKSGPKLSASTAKGLVTRSGTAPSIWRIRRMAK